MLQFFVPGDPKPQGSKRAFVVAGKARLCEANAGHRPWRDSVTYAAQAEMARQGIQGTAFGPISLTVSFYHRRPKAHFDSKGHLKSTAPVLISKKHADLDKLCRAVCDSLTDAGVWLDDSQCAVLHARNCYALTGGPGAEIELDRAG